MIMMRMMRITQAIVKFSNRCSYADNNYDNHSDRDENICDDKDDDDQKMSIEIKLMKF